MQLLKCISLLGTGFSCLQCRAITAEEKAHLRVKLSTLIPQDDNQVRTPRDEEGEGERKSGRGRAGVGEEEEEQRGRVERKRV